MSSLKKGLCLYAQDLALFIMGLPAYIYVLGIPTYVDILIYLLLRIIICTLKYLLPESAGNP